MTSIEAYEILKQRQMNEDRILGERTSIFLLATSFLFLAFVTLLNPDWTGTIFTVLRILLPIVGLFLTFLLYCFNQGAINALAFWHDSEKKIEEEAPEFAYMRESEIAPHIHMKEPKSWWKKRLLRSRAIYKRYIPIAFFVLWITALAVAIVSIVS